MRRRHPLVGVVLLALVASAIGIFIVLQIDWWPSQASSAASEIDTLYDVLLIVSVPILVLVMSVVLYSVYAFRARPGDMRDGAPIHGNTRLEIIWVTIPFLIVSALAAYGWVVLSDVEARQSDTLTVDVTAQQFAWSFAYPEQRVKDTEIKTEIKTNQLVVPVNGNIHFRINTKDVLHDFWVPHFRLKSDAVPGITTDVRVTPTEIGTYPVVCAELCGIGHATMRQSLRVVSEDAYKTWVAEQQQSESDGGVAAAGGDSAAAGKRIFTDTGCDGCHALADAGSTANVGPNLNDLTADAAKYGKQQGMDPAAYVHESIVKPNDFVVPGFQKGLMPEGYADQLSQAEIDTLVQYLLSVSKGGQGK
jgi:cytochrome c oxidase subunit 2